MRHRLVWFARWVLMGAPLLLLMAGCNGGFGAFQEGVGDTPNRPPLSAFRILGEPGLQFTAEVSDADSTWQVRGAIPLNVIIVNNLTPVRMIATKLSGGSGILSVQLTLGFVVEDVASTADPYGSATLQNNPLYPGTAPPPPLANPDVRLFVKGPPTERFAGLFEDSVKGFEISDRAPALFLFDNPDGAIDASITQIQNLGLFDVDLLLNGAVVAHATGGPTITIRQP
jgi:hypothetical protein